MDPFDDVFPIENGGYASEIEVISSIPNSPPTCQIQLQVEAKVVDQVSRLEGRLATVEALVPDLQTLYGGLATVMQRHCEIKEVTPSQVTSLREEVKEMQAGGGEMTVDFCLSVCIIYYIHI